jgi:SprT-like family
VTTRRKILLAILAGLALFGLGQAAYPQEVKHHPDTSVEMLRKWYREFNEAYFQNKLPDNTTFDLNLRNGNMAQTSIPGWAVFNISMDPHYVAAQRMGQLTLLHEMCHVETFTDSRDPKVQHGEKWLACMTRIDVAGGFRDIIIDRYEKVK